MTQNIYVVKDKVSGLMTSQLIVCDNDLVAIKGFADSLKNVNKELMLDSELYRIGSIKEDGTISDSSSSRLFNDVFGYMVKICTSSNYNEVFQSLVEKYNAEHGED